MKKSSFLLTALFICLCLSATRECHTQTQVNMLIGLTQDPKHVEQNVIRYELKYYIGQDSSSMNFHLPGSGIYVAPTSPDEVWTSYRTTQTKSFYFKAVARAVNKYGTPSVWAYSKAYWVEINPNPDPPPAPTEPNPPIRFKIKRGGS